MWLEERTGLSTARLRELCTLRVSRSAGRSILMAAAILTLVGTQAVSGMLLAMYYKPSWDRAHASVEVIVTLIPLGWLVRGVHIWGAHLLVVGALLHLVRTFRHERYSRPRELAWMLLVGVVCIVLAEAATGQLLPLDESAVAGAPIAADVAGSVGMGGVICGGKEPGDFMLGRFFAAHALALPAVGLLMLAAHIGLARRQPSTTDASREVPAVLSATQGALGSLAAVAVLAVAAPPGLEAAGSMLETPEGVRPLWPFLPAYQALKWVPSIVVALSGVLALVALLALPFVRGRWLRYVLIAGSMAAVLLGVMGALAGRNVAGLHFDAYAIPRRAS